MRTLGPDKTEARERQVTDGVCEIDLIHPESVQAARAALPERATMQHVAAIFQVLSDPTRASIVFALTSVDELCVCDVAAVVGLSISATSHQLKRLRDQGVVTYRSEGRMAYYRLQDDHIRQLILEGVGHVHPLA